MLMALPILSVFLALLGGLLYLYLKIDSSAAFDVITSSAARWIIFAAQAATIILCMVSFMRRDGLISRNMSRAGLWFREQANELFARQARSLGTNNTFRRRGQLAMTVVRADDTAWLRDVRALIQASDVVIIDLSNPSENIGLEVRELSRLPGRAMSRELLNS